MSWKIEIKKLLFQLVEERELTHAEFLVLLRLAEYADFATGENARPSAETLARVCATTERTVRRALQHAVAIGIVQLVARGGGAGASARGNCYRFMTTGSQGSNPMLDPHEGPDIDLDDDSDDEADATADLTADTTADTTPDTTPDTGATRPRRPQVPGTPRTPIETTTTHRRTTGDGQESRQVMEVDERRLSKGMTPEAEDLRRLRLRQRLSAHGGNSPSGA